MDEWKQSFVERLGRVQSRWAARLDQTLDAVVKPVFDDLAEFLRENGFSASTPLRASGRRSFKFELAEDAYVLLIFRSVGVGEFELSREVFLLGSPPDVTRLTERVATLDADWARAQFQAALDAFVEILSGRENATEPELVEA